MSVASIDRKETSVSDTKNLLTETVRVAGSFYGDLNSLIGESTTPQELTDNLRVARRVLWEQQVEADVKSPLHERLTGRIAHITNFIDQVKATFEGEVK